MSIGVEVNGAIVAGAIYDPSADEMFTAEKGGGAFLNGKKIHVSSSDSLINSLLVTGFPYNVKENPNHVVEHFVKLLMEGQGVRRLGSAALDLAYVAAGRLDGYWEVFLILGIKPPEFYWFRKQAELSLILKTMRRASTSRTRLRQMEKSISR